MALAAGLHQVHHGPPTAPHLGIFKAASCFLSLDSRWVSGVHQLEPVEKLGYDFDTSNLNLDIFSAILDIPTMGGNHFEPKWRNFAMKDPIVADEFPLPKRGFPLVKSWCGQRLDFELWERILPSQTTLSCRRSQKHRLYWFNFVFIEYIHVPANIPRYP